MGDRRDEETAGDLVDRRVVVGEDKAAILAMALQELFEHLELRGRGLRETLLLAPCLEGLPALGRAARRLDEALPAVLAAEADAAVGDEAPVGLAGLAVVLQL